MTTMAVAHEPIDVVIPCAPKDTQRLNLAIEGIRKYGFEIGRIIVVSKSKLTDRAEWFPEGDFPFSIESIRKVMGIAPGWWRVGWYYQQLLKLYVFKVIPDLSRDVLLLDSDCIFLNPTSFRSSDDKIFLSWSSEYNPKYFVHMERLLPGLKKQHPDRSGIVDHMVIRREHINDLMNRVEIVHGTPFWKAFIGAILPKNLFHVGASEFEIIFNFIQENYPDQIALRKLKQGSCKHLELINLYRRRGYNCMSFHDWMVNKVPSTRPSFLSAT